MMEREIHLCKVILLIILICIIHNNQSLAQNMDARLDTAENQVFEDNQLLVLGQDFGPGFDNVDGQVIYSRVCELDLAREDLFTNAQRWILEHIHENYTLFSDKNADRLTIMGTGKLKSIDQGMIKISYQIDWKDKKYRYKFKVLDIYTDQFVLSFDTLLRHPEKTELTEASVEEIRESVYKSMFRHVKRFERNMEVNNQF